MARGWQRRLQRNDRMGIVDENSLEPYFLSNELNAESNGKFSGNVPQQT